MENPIYKIHLNLNPPHHLINLTPSIPSVNNHLISTISTCPPIGPEIVGIKAIVETKAKTISHSWVRSISKISMQPSKSERRLKTQRFYSNWREAWMALGSKTSFHKLANTALPVYTQHWVCVGTAKTKGRKIIQFSISSQSKNNTGSLIYFQLDALPHWIYTPTTYANTEYLPLTIMLFEA